MSHEIETMAYAGKTPWHKLGTYVGDEVVCSSEMIVKAGLDWEVRCQSLYTQGVGDDLAHVPTHVGIVRQSDARVLGLASKSYQPLQNAEAFAVLDSLVSEGQMRYHTAGSMRGGQRVWALGKIGSFEVVPKDRIDNYILIYTGHDGWTATRVLWTQVRVVCANTARAALSVGKGEGISVRHTKNQMTTLKTAHRVLGIAQENLERSTEFLRATAATTLTEERWVKLAGELIPDPEKGSAARARAKREDLTRLLFRGRGQQLPGVEGTLYAARNAITEYCNYNRQTRGDEDVAQEKRFEGSLWGSSAEMIAKGDEIIHDMLGAPSDLEPEAEPVDAQDLMSSLSN